ncbi:antileukoproteinase-like isoform X2 [Talpa occidentalis]|uniref:antileukoproteinase-like isoform X2 n=1 Tax=Talpa occidentalis TaxID=50954 RepID=UPI00189021C2|nr:antileukoproteinase-like isoform X2 [Talpa occidentalis]
MKSNGLLPLTLLVLGTLAPWAVKGAGDEAVKAGGCPYRGQVRCFRYEDPECQSDWQCPEEKRCCPDYCGIKCLDPVKLSNPVNKPGQCPAVYGECMMLNPPNHCETDGECVGNLKCCKGMCGKLCVTPVNGSSKGKTWP